MDCFDQALMFAGTLTVVLQIGEYRTRAWTAGAVSASMGISFATMGLVIVQVAELSEFPTFLLEFLARYMGALIVF